MFFILIPVYFTRERQKEAIVVMIVW